MKERFKSLLKHCISANFGLLIVATLFVLFPLATQGLTFLGGWESEVLVGIEDDPNWLLGYGYRTELEVDDSLSGAQTNYPMMFTIYKNTGAGVGTIGLGGNCQDDFDDIRFTEADGITEIDYWTDPASIVSGTSCETWIEISDTADETFYIYYDKPSETNGSSGANTFTLFDDFERSGNGDPIAGAWTISVGNADISTEQAYAGTRSGKFVGDGTVTQIYIAKTAGTNYSIMYQAYKEDADYLIVEHGNGTERFILNFETDEDISYQNGGINVVGTGTADDWELFEINDINHATPKFDIWLNGAKIKDNADMYNSPLRNNQIWFNSATSWNDSYIDNFIVRKWTSTEPSWATNGDTDVSSRNSSVLAEHVDFGDTSLVLGINYYPDVDDSDLPYGQEAPTDIAPPTGQPNWTGQDQAQLANHPFYPLVNGLSTASGIPEKQLWIIGATLIILGATMAGYARAPHQLITVAIGTVLTILFVIQLIFPWWVIFVYLVMGVAILIYEREPTIA